MGFVLFYLIFSMSIFVNITYISTNIIYKKLISNSDNYVNFMYLDLLTLTQHKKC